MAGDCGQNPSNSIYWIHSDPVCMFQMFLGFCSPLTIYEIYEFTFDPVEVVVLAAAATGTVPLSEICDASEWEDPWDQLWQIQSHATLKERGLQKLRRICVITYLERHGTIFGGINQVIK